MGKAVVETREELVARMRAEKAAKSAARDAARQAARKEACGPTVYLLKWDDGSLYIGSTTNFVNRTYYHRSSIRRGTHRSSRLNGMSPDFEAVVLCKCQSVERMLEIEESTLREYFTRFGPKVLNITSPVTGETLNYSALHHPNTEGKEHIQ